MYEIGTPEYDALLPEDKRQPGSRAVIALDVYKVASVSLCLLSAYSARGYRTLRSFERLTSPSLPGGWLTSSPDMRLFGAVLPVRRSPHAAQRLGC